MELFMNLEEDISVKYLCVGGGWRKERDGWYQIQDETIWTTSGEAIKRSFTSFPHPLSVFSPMLFLFLTQHFCMWILDYHNGMRFLQLWIITQFRITDENGNGSSSFLLIENYAWHLLRNFPPTRVFIEIYSFS